MFALMSQLPRESRLIRVTSDGESDWTLSDHLAAAAVDALNAANWQRGGGKGSKPKPIPRPGVKGDNQRVVGRVTGKGRTREQLDALLARHVYGEG